MNITTEQFIELFAKNLSTTKSQAKKEYEAFFQTLKELVKELEDGESLKLKSNIKISATDVQEKECFNPKTREKIIIPARRKYFIKFSKLFL